MSALLADFLGRERNEELFHFQSSVLLIFPQILDMNCEVRRDGEKRELFLRLNFGDKMQRELTSELKDGKFSYVLCVL